jgi:hypothetical protein
MNFTEKDILSLFFYFPALLALILFILAACAVSTTDYNYEKRQEQLYCDMVQTFQESNGEYGWPDYNLNAAEICE